MQLERHDGVPVLMLDGEVELTRTSALRDELLGAVTNQDYGLVVDMRGVTYLDSAGVHVLFDVAERLESRQQELVAVVPDRAIIERVLELVDLRSAISTHGSLEAAISRVKAKAPQDPSQPKSG